MPTFSHLHVHTQFSLLDGAASIKSLMQKAKKDGMPAVALTDHGNMFGAFKFVAEANAQGIKPIVGCEFYLVKDRHIKEFGKGKKDERYHQLLLAKNKQGYENLSKLCSIGYIEGYYSKYPRIDKELLLKYHEGIIATSCCIGAEIPQTILRKGEEEAEKQLQWWLDLFGEDYYIELQRHHLQNLDNTGISQEDINQILLKWAKKYNLKVIATNDSHYVDQSDADAHDILLCINTGEKKSTPVGDGKGYRFGFPNKEFFFKTQAEMEYLFKDIPQALDNTNDIVGKVESLQLKRDILLPNYQLPTNFKDQFEYLRHITFIGAHKKYKQVTPEIEQRLNFELDTIQKMGFSGYFLIVQDFINAAIDLGVRVGLGRGSAAGSAVAYCIGITNIDPIQYDLLFERFLNPERVSMPDIDTDFDDIGRQKVIDYVVDKYGKNQVAQIITYGSMAAKMAIKDVARVMELPLDESNKLAKLVPEKPGTKLKDAIDTNPELKGIYTTPQEDMRKEVLRDALVLEGSVRGTGIHAAGIIIAPDDITKYIPVCTSKDSDLLVTQFDGKVIEDAGMLKMDFLGLKTLTIIRDALMLIKKRHNVDINIDEIDLQDQKTYQLYQNGDTIGTFQFESEGMQMYLKQLKPTNIEDLIAMNALYRPGPLQFIPVYINRKHGREKVEYPHDLLKPILEKTYGIMVYQEQIMQTAQILAGYTLGGADLLRRAMGKKDKEKMAKEREKFIAGAKQLHQIEEKKASEIFDIMEKFAEYGFNRSHSAAYSVLAYQTAYLKANYTAEYMAAVLTHNMNDIEKIAFFIEEARRMNVEVLGPDVNESLSGFSVNKEGKIRFGLAAIKGTGEAAVENVINEREKKQYFTDIYDFVTHVSLRTFNKKSFESFAQAGAFDSFNISRATFFDPAAAAIERLIKYGNAVQEAKNDKNNLFGGSPESSITQPKIASTLTWNKLEQLKREKETVGFYISGHPLNEYKAEIKAFSNCPLSAIEQQQGKEVNVVGIITKAQVKHTKNGAPFTTFVIEDYSTALELALFGEDHNTFKDIIELNKVLLIKGKVQKKYGSEDKYEIRVQNISDLEDKKGQMCKGIRIFAETRHINPQWIDQIETLIQQNSGNLALQLILLDVDQKIQLETTSQKYKVAFNEQLTEAMQKMQLRYEWIY
ncbi:MAG: DNA polymerase III subunit alpha [Cytophagales bacterium]|nr:MAG: DNA polymerase III subunit alpha [Cytophagales bacterium]